MSIPYRLIRSSRKTLALEVNHSGEVLVRAPYRVPQKEIDVFVDSHSEWLKNALEKQRRRATAHPPLTDIQQEELIQAAKQLLPRRVAHYAEIMGVCPTGVRITGAKRRFGSCSPKNSLCFSFLLMQYPKEAIDYVVVHELAHIIHHNHSKAFWKMVECYMPDYRERQRLLKL